MIPVVVGSNPISHPIRPTRGSRRAFVCGVAVSIIACASHALAAEAVIGSVLAVRGVVVAEAEKAPPRPLVVNARVNAGDTIVSTAGKAKIALNDGTVVSVGENSRIRLADYASAPTRGQVRMHLVAGVARFTAKIAPGASFEVETETAIAAVRGTDWLMEVTPGQTAVALIEGAVAVTSRNGARAMVVLDTPQQGTDVRRGAAPTPPRPWGAQRFADTLARATYE